MRHAWPLTPPEGMDGVVGWASSTRLVLEQVRAPRNEFERIQLAKRTHCLLSPPFHAAFQKKRNLRERNSQGQPTFLHWTNTVPLRQAWPCRGQTQSPPGNLDV